MRTSSYPLRALLALPLLAASTAAEAGAPVSSWIRSATAAPGLGPLRAAARARREGGDAARVLSALAEAPEERTEGWREVWPLVAWWRAEAHASLEDRRAARSARAGALLEPPPCEGAPSAIAEALQDLEVELLKADDPTAAAALAISGRASAARLARAREMLEEGDRRDVEARLLAAYPASPEARALAEALGAAGVAARLGTPERRLERVRNLLEAHENQAAVTEAAALQRELGDAHAFACELGYIEGKARRKLRHYRGAQARLEAARKRCTKAGDRELAMRAALLETRVRAIRGQIRGTRALADWIAKVAPEHSYADDALAMHADVLERKGRADQAREAYRRLLERFEAGDMVPLAAWRLAFDAIRAHDRAAATPLLERILASEDARPMDHARARYWLGALALGAKDREAAFAHFDRLVLEPSFYGWMALDRLAKVEPKWVAKWKARLLEVRGAASAPVPVEDLGPARAAAVRAAWLVQAGLHETAEAELAGYACKLTSDPQRRALAAAYDALGLHPAAQMVARARQPRWRPGRVEAARMVDWRTAYSRPFTDEISAAADAAKVEPLFLTALSREESTFDPEIVSWAGAIGLAQLMPATAVGAYADVFGGRLDMNRLTEPALNLRLGAHVLGQGLRRFRRTEALALAAYNGGPGLAARFVPDEALPFDVWVETPTVKETRRYVKRVLETWGIYRWLYAEDRPFIDLPDSVGGSDWKR